MYLVLLWCTHNHYPCWLIVAFLASVYDKINIKVHLEIGYDIYVAE